jgi:hypothetical protein
MKPTLSTVSPPSDQTPLLREGYYICRVWVLGNETNGTPDVLIGDFGYAVGNYAGVGMASLLWAVTA